MNWYQLFQYLESNDLLQPITWLLWAAVVGSIARTIGVLVGSIITIKVTK